RAQQAHLVAEHVRNSPYPVMICGDFNETPLSYVYRILSAPLQDAFKQKGSGLGTTYAGKIPALRIDYILADRRLKILDHQILYKSYSDHYPVRSSFEWPTQ
ncbi:MAG: endonuclease/exonuclease/phosphatase family protein, partial [Bacteroidota bacterium]